MITWSDVDRWFVTMGAFWPVAIFLWEFRFSVLFLALGLVLSLLFGVVSLCYLCCEKVGGTFRVVS